MDGEQTAVTASVTINKAGCHSRGGYLVWKSVPMKGVGE